MEGLLQEIKDRMLALETTPGTEVKEKLTGMEVALKSHSSRIQRLDDQVAVGARSHQTLHDQVMQQETAAAAAAPQAKGGGHKRVDRTLVPPPYAGDPTGWRMWAAKFINCLSETHPPLRKILTTIQS